MNFLGSISGLLLYLASGAAFFCVLYFVVRAAVRDGVRQAERRSRSDEGM